MTWSTAPVKYAAAINRSVLAESTPNEYRFKYIDISAVGSTGQISIPDEWTAFDLAPSRARRTAPAGATVVSTVRTYLRAVARVPETEDPLVFSTGFATLEAGQDVDPAYLAYACQSDQFIDEVVARSTGVSYPAINPSDLGQVPIPQPPRDVQRRIAYFLDDQTTGIDQIIRDRLLQAESLTAAMDAFAFSAVTGQRLGGDRSPSSIPWAPELPVGWGAPRLTQVARMGTGHTPSRSEPEYWMDCDIPWLTTADVHKFRQDQIDALSETEFQISALGLANSAAVLHPAGTVALSRTASAGFSIIMGQEMATSQDYATWTCGPALNNRYLLWCLRAMRRDLLGRLAMGSTHKTIYFPDLMSIRIPLPSLRDQVAAAEAIQPHARDVRAVRDQIQHSIGLVREFKRALISAAVTGEFDVTTASGRGVAV